MFFETKDQLLPKGIFKSCIIPRPIAWISSISKDGVTNLAPFSYFQAICDKPPMIMFVTSPKKENSDQKDTAINIEETKEFVINLVTYDDRKIMDLTSNPLPYGESEIEEYDIQTKASKLVKPPSIVSSPVNIECEYVKTIPIESSKMIIGKVLGIQIEDKFIKDDKVDVGKLQLIARLGYSRYTRVSEVFSIRD
jgi:flavin reductase (DIM6/NTAB) family NADH-FMN oxidoreductase RutF